MNLNAAAEILFRPFQLLNYSCKEIIILEMLTLKKKRRCQILENAKSTLSFFYLNALNTSDANDKKSLAYGK
jgi:hypothetical protein